MRRRTRQSRQLGGALIEFVIVAPFFLGLIGAIVQFGMIFNAQLTLRNAAAIGARYAALTNPSPTADEVKSVVVNSLAPLNTDDLSLNSVELNVTVGSITDAKRVSLSYKVPLLFGFALRGGVFTVSASVVMH